MTIDASSEEVHRWTAKRKAAVVLDLLASKTTSAEVARSHGLTVSEVEQWKADFIAQGTESLRSHPRDQAAQEEARAAVPGQDRRSHALGGHFKKPHRILGKDLPDGIS